MRHRWKRIIPKGPGNVEMWLKRGTMSRNVHNWGGHRDRHRQKTSSQTTPDTKLRRWRELNCMHGAWICSVDFSSVMKQCETWQWHDKSDHQKHDANEASRKGKIHPLGNMNVLSMFYDNVFIRFCFCFVVFFCLEVKSLVWCWFYRKVKGLTKNIRLRALSVMNIHSKFHENLIRDQHPHSYLHSSVLQHRKTHKKHMEIALSPSLSSVNKYASITTYFTFFIISYYIIFNQ